MPCRERRRSLGTFMKRFTLIGALLFPSILFAQDASRVSTQDQYPFNSPNLYSVGNQWGGDRAPWHDGGEWILGGRDTQRVVAIQISSRDEGLSLHGTMTYEREGPVSFRGFVTEDNQYRVENRWGGNRAPWHDGGIWTIGGRDGQPVVRLEAKSKDGGATLSGSVAYNGEGSIGFRASRISLSEPEYCQSLDGFCYVVDRTPRNFWDAEQACADQYGGHLASVHSWAENEFIGILVDRHAEGKITAWIGGYAPRGFTAGAGATYQWTDGSPWRFSKWRTNTSEPNSTPAGQEAGIQFWPTMNGRLSGWNDVPANEVVMASVCKF